MRAEFGPRVQFARDIARRSDGIRTCEGGSKRTVLAETSRRQRDFRGISRLRILEGNVREVLPTLPEESIHCVVTSPPYWGLRDYGLPPVLWGGDSSRAATSGPSSLPDGNGPRTTSGTPPRSKPATRGEHRAPADRRVRSVRRVGRPARPWSRLRNSTSSTSPRCSTRSVAFSARDGTLWLNLGDTFHTDSPVRHSSSEAFLRIWDPSQTRSRGGNAKKRLS